MNDEIQTWFLPFDASKEVLDKMLRNMRSFNCDFRHISPERIPPCPSWQVGEGWTFSRCLTEIAETIGVATAEKDSCPAPSIIVQQPNAHPFAKLAVVSAYQPDPVPSELTQETSLT
jgi:hypothetical protein